MVFLAALIFCGGSIFVACQTADNRFDASLKQCVEPNSEKPNEAIGCLNKLPALNPDRGIIYYFLANSYRRLEQFDEAERNIDVFTRNYPNDASGRESFCRILMEKGDLPNALGECVRAVSLQPDNISYRLTTAEVQIKAGDYESAEKTYRDALKN